MKNGDHLSGEVKKLENVLLYLDTDYVSGSIQLDWLQVDRVQSTGSFQIALKNGDRLVGTIEKLPTENAPRKDFEVRTGGREVYASALDFVEIASQKPSFWS